MHECCKCIYEERSISDKLREENEELKSIRTNVLKFLDTELCDNHFAIAKNQSFHDFNKSQKDAGCRLCLRQENEGLKKRVDSEYNRGIEDAAKVADDKYGDFEGYRYDMGGGQCGFNKACSDISEAILKLRRG